MISAVEKEEFQPSGVLPDIIEAAYAGNYKLVSELLAAGEDVNAVDPADNLTILHIACLQGDMELTKVILDYELRFGGVDFTVKSLHRPRLAWQFAMNGNFTEIAELVDQAGLSRLSSTKPNEPNLSKP